MRSTFRVLFYIKGNAIKSNGKAPIMARITLDGKVSQFSLKCEVNPANWNPNAGKAIGKTAQIQQLNNLLDRCRAKIMHYYQELSDKDSVLTAEKIRNVFLGQDNNNETLIYLFKNQIKTMQTRANNNLVGKHQVQRYVRTCERLQFFMQEKYNISDINIKEINHSFIYDFELFLKTNYSCGHNSTIKILQLLRTVVLIAKNDGKLHIDPFANYKLSFEKTERGYLTEEELNIITNKSFSIKRLEQVRDIFLFSCYTGLSYIDVKNLTLDNIRQSFDENMWIIGKREKTNITYRVPLLEIPNMIIEKYKDSSPNGLILPVLSNQKMNAYLKEIADICGINKSLSFHLARHTFATFTLTK
jgi:site-specific recombinase XerD